jgi:hypothetical protein
MESKIKNIEATVNIRIPGSRRTIIMGGFTAPEGSAEWCEHAISLINDFLQLRMTHEQRQYMLSDGVEVKQNFTDGGYEYMDLAMKVLLLLSNKFHYTTEDIVANKNNEQIDLRGCATIVNELDAKLLAEKEHPFTNDIFLTLMLSFGIMSKDAYDWIGSECTWNQEPAIKNLFKGE